MSQDPNRSTRAQHARRQHESLARYLDHRLTDRLTNDQDVRSALEDGRVAFAAILLTDAILPTLQTYVAETRTETLAAVVSVASKLANDA